MRNIENISPFQFFVIVLVCTVGNAILIIPSILAGFGKQDAWLISVVGLGVGVGLIYFYNKLASLFPNKSFVEYTEIVLGKFLGKIVTASYLIFFFILTSGLIREIGDFFTTQVMPETPIEVINTLFLFVSIVGVRLGIEVIGRTSEIFLPWVIILLLLMIVFLTFEIDFNNIKPIMENGLPPIMKGTLPYLAITFLELSVLLMVIPHVNNGKKRKHAFYTGGILGGSILILIVMMNILVLGADFSERNTYPTYILAKKISVGNFVERIEIFVAIAWFLTVYFKTSICLFALNKGLSQIFKLQNDKVLLFPLGFIIIGFSILGFPNIVYLQELAKLTWPFYSLTINLLLPMFVFIVGILRKKKLSVYQ